MIEEPVISKKTGKPVYGYAAYVSKEWSEINKTRTEKVTQKKFITISKKLGQKWRKMTKKIKSTFSRPASDKKVTKPKKEPQEKSSQESVDRIIETNENRKVKEPIKEPTKKSSESISSKTELENQKRELSNQREEFEKEKTELNFQKKQLIKERKKLANEKAAFAREQEELVIQTLAVLEGLNIVEETAAEEPSPETERPVYLSNTKITSFIP